MNPLLLTDFYKIHHNRQYPQGMTKLYSNFTPRKSRIKEVNEVVVFGTQHFIKEYLINGFNERFFNKERNEVISEYTRHCPVDAAHIAELHDLGYLPIQIKALEEGTICPIGVPVLTITNTHPNFGWLVNYLETLLSCMLWQPMTSATIAYQYKKLLNKYNLETAGSTEFTQWQGHDFSMRGMSSRESAILSAMGHLTSFTGTDTIPAIYQLEKSYKADGLIGASVPATEHSVMCMGQKEAEIETFKRLLDLYPTGILSVVSDTWDLWKVCTEYLPQLKEQISARDGKLVIRPDSGDPVDIICGLNSRIIRETEEDCIFDFSTDHILEENGKYYDIIADFSYCEYLGNIKGKELYLKDPEIKGVIELLWDTFGGTINEQGYKVLDSHIGAIYGDSITLERAEQICERLKAKGFATTNIVFGIGSYTYQYNTRDTFGFAMKATYGEVNGEAREIFKDPITDDGTKRSKKGLLQVVNDYENLGRLKVNDQQTWVGEGTGLLQTVFLNGELKIETNLESVREKLK